VKGSFIMNWNSPKYYMKILSYDFSDNIRNINVLEESTEILLEVTIVLV
jgi:hypothetical protein